MHHWVYAEERLICLETGAYISYYPTGSHEWHLSLSVDTESVVLLACQSEGSAKLGLDALRLRLIDHVGCLDLVKEIICLEHNNKLKGT